MKNNIPVNSYKEVIALWPDQSVKWVHVHGIFKWKKNYNFIQTNQQVFGPFQAIKPDSDLHWELQVEEADGHIWKNTSQDRNTLPTIPETEYKLSLIDITGGWSYNDSEDTKFVELNNDFLRITRYEWLRNNGEKSVFKYCTRVTRYSDAIIGMYSF